ncbi:MAG: hypothetical protein ACMVY4_04720 [Minwuia sp.]|uniref:hypothetical protein n=1 Tax=Minwuia sp. TaxID=2493630 RepID=UPI003A8AEF1F
MTDDESREDGLRRAFAQGFDALEEENARLRRQVERQSMMLADHLERDRLYRKLLEDHYQLLRAREKSEAEGNRHGPLLKLSVREVMDLPDRGGAAAAGEADAGLESWMQGGAETGEMQPVIPGEPLDEPFGSIPRPFGLTFRLSPGLAAFGLNRGDLRPLAFNLIGRPDGDLEHLAEEIAQSAALNRKFAPLILTTTRSELQAFRRRRLVYESLPPFDDAVARLSGIKDSKAFYDLRVGFLLRKWRVVAVMNMGVGYAYRGSAQNRTGR